MNADEEMSKKIFAAVNDALPREKFDVACQTIITYDYDICVVTIVAKER